MSNLNSNGGCEVKRKRIIREEVDSLTIHGWPRIVSAKSNFTKVLWCTLCLTSTGLLIYFTIQSFLKHMKHDVIVNTNRNQLKTIKFPAITFCNSNLFSLYNYWDGLHPVNQKLPEHCSMADGDHFKNEINRDIFKLGCKMFFGNSTKFTSQVAVDLGYKFKFPQHFSLLPHSYPCFTLNRNSEFFQEVVSARAGIHILIQFDEKDRRIGAGDTSSDSVLSDSRNGVYVAIHSPQDFHGDDGIPLSPGFETRISIQKSIMKRKKSPFPSKCLDDNEQQFENIFPGRPSIDSCYSSCYFINLYRYCHYVPSYMRPFMSNKTFPDKESYPACTEEELKENNILSNCKCHLPCYKEYYKTNVMQSVWPQEWQARKFGKLLRKSSPTNDTQSMDINDIRRRLMKVVIYYDDLAEYHYEEKELYDIITILSDFGGQMGLFIGASIISVMEIGALFWIAIKSLWKKEKLIGSDDSNALPNLYPSFRTGQVKAEKCRP